MQAAQLVPWLPDLTKGPMTVLADLRTHKVSKESQQVADVACWALHSLLVKFQDIHLLWGFTNSITGRL